jgi:hypothetical protein
LTEYLYQWTKHGFYDWITIDISRANEIQLQNRWEEICYLEPIPESAGKTVKLWSLNSWLASEKHRKELIESLEKEKANIEKNQEEQAWIASKLPQARHLLRESAIKAGVSLSDKEMELMIANALKDRGGKLAVKLGLGLGLRLEPKTEPSKSE